jgi:diaminohydroxyphosphoribosylaminopyrimidine deaminase/5-amino-6-(5-phosphoribosylamino)uracil reductase
MKPEEAMRLALRHARRGLGRTHPNPSVGAVVFRAGGVVGAGRTEPPPGAHAEVVALRAAARRGRTRGASLAVTLEPCCFTGRTGPCTDAILAAGIRRVYVGARDPHPRVAGRGIRQLRRAGVAVETGLLEEACREQHRGFFSVCERGRPFVTLKLASSLDGRIATRSGDSRWISGPTARAFVHRLRSRVDALMVGSGTALADDPALTARKGGRVVHRPARVLVDSRLRVPVSSKLFRPGAPVWVLAGRNARGARGREEAGARVLPVRKAPGGIDLARGLEALAGCGITTLLVEGGGKLAAALLRAGLVDELLWIQSPVLIGSDGLPGLAGLGVERLTEAIRLEGASRRALGPDVLWQTRLSR